MNELFSKCVFIGEYDCFYGWDIVLNGVSLRNTSDGKKIIKEFEDYACFFKKKFPDKIVVYNCDGHYTFFIDGKKIEL